MIDKAIRSIIDQKNIRQEQLAALSGLSISQVSHILTGKSQPRKSTLSKIALCLGVSVEDILQESKRLGATLTKAGGAGGLFGLETDASFESLLTQYILPSFEGAQFVTTVIGQSMAPRLQGGDLVACAYLPDEFEPITGKIYQITTPGGKFIKRLGGVTPEGLYTFESDNPDYPPLVLDKKLVKRWARVVGVISLE